jgi:hypothetical protein
MSSGDCGDLACTSWWGYVVLLAWLTMSFALLRGNPWAGVTAPAVAAGFVLMAEHGPVGVAVLVLLAGWSLFEAAWAYRCPRAQRQFLAGRLGGQTASLTMQAPRELPAWSAGSAHPAPDEVATGRAARLARVLGPGVADPVLRYYLGFRLGWAVLLLAGGGLIAILTGLHAAQASGDYDAVVPLVWAAVLVVPGLRLAVSSWSWGRRLVRIAGTGHPTITMTARRHGRWLSLYPEGGAAEGMVPAASVVLMDDPDGAVGPPWAEVEVRGSLAEGGALVVRQGDQVLWPFEGARTGSRFAARVLATPIRLEQDAASHGRLLFDYRPRFWFQVWRRVHGRCRVTLWSDGTLRRDSSLDTDQVSLHGCRSLDIEDEGELVFQNDDRVFAANTLIRVRDDAGRTHKLRVLRGMPLGKRRQLEQLAAGFMADPTPVALAAARQPADQPVELLAGSGANPAPGGSSAPAAASQADGPPGPDHPPTWRSRLADACGLPVGLGMVGGIIVTGVMFESGVDSDATDPLLWAALLVCCGLAATGLTALLDRPRSRGQVPVVGLVGLAGLIAIPLFWSSLTGSVPAPEAEAEVGIGSPEVTAPETTTAPKLSNVTVDRTANVGVFQIHLTAITCGYAELADLGAAERGQYCVVRLTATNVRSSPNVRAAAEWLYDAQQRLSVTSGESFKGFGLGERLWYDELRPGQRVTTRLVFDLPRGARPVQLRLQADAYRRWGQEIVTINLPRR